MPLGWCSYNGERGTPCGCLASDCLTVQPRLWTWLARCEGKGTSVGVASFLTRLALRGELVERLLVAYTISLVHELPKSAGEGVRGSR